MGRQLLTSAGLIKFLVLSVLVSGVKFTSVKFLSVQCSSLVLSVNFCPTHQLSRSTRDPPTLHRRSPISPNPLNTTGTSKTKVNTSKRRT